MDEFEEVASIARPTTTPGTDGNALSRRRNAMAKVVSSVYRSASDALRADMLKRLLRPLGVLGLAAVASGAFARLVRRDGLPPDTISAEDLVRYSSEQIRELTVFVHEVNPDALQALVEELTRNGVGLAALSTAALLMLRHGSPGRSALARKADSSPGQDIGNRGSEQS
jgi:hypothetical protein